MEEIKLSYWFMKDNHTFIKPEGKSLRRVAANLAKIAKKNPYGMVCPVIVLKNDKEIGHIGKPAHVDCNGYVDINSWILNIKGNHSLNDITVNNVNNVNISIR